MKIPGIDLARECKLIDSKAHQTAIGRRISSSYENLVKIFEPRDGFVRLSDSDIGDIAVDHIGRGTGARITRYENPVTGVKEHILGCSRYAYRMLFNKENKSLGTIIFDNSSYPRHDGIAFHVVVPNETGHSVEILPDGRKILYHNGEEYDKQFGINSFAAMVETSPGQYVKKIFGGK